MLVEHPSSSAVARIVGGGARVEFCHAVVATRSTRCGCGNGRRQPDQSTPSTASGCMNRSTSTPTSASRGAASASRACWSNSLTGTTPSSSSTTSQRRSGQPTVLWGEEEPPAPEPWVAAGFHVPVVSWEGLHGADHLDATIAALDAFFRYGFFVLRGTLAQPGALNTVAAHFGRISATNFGTLFDVRTVPAPVDLAYTPVALSAHTDQPYRRPTPGIQFLHAIVNDAPGGRLDDRRRPSPRFVRCASSTNRHTTY